nr:shematrin-like protein 2 [Cherax quadricarinatus]
MKILIILLVVGLAAARPGPVANPDPEAGIGGFGLGGLGYGHGGRGYGLGGLGYGLGNLGYGGGGYGLGYGPRFFGGFYG